MLDQVRQGMVNGRVSDDVIIIEHKHEVLSRPSEQVVGEHGQHRFGFRGLWEAKPCGSESTKVGIKRLQGGNQVGEEANRLIVLRLKREPGDGRGCRSSPLGQQGRFAVSGRRRDEREWACHSLLKSLNKAGARHKVGARTGHMEPGCEQEVGRIMMGVVQGKWCSASVSG